MKLKLMVLRKLVNHKGEKIDNRTMTWEKWKKVLIGEVKELCEALSSGNKLDIMEEVLDVIQVGIGILAKLLRENFDIVQGFHRHNKKLVDRGCEACGEVGANVCRK